MRTALVAYLSAAILVDLAFAQVRVVRRDDDRLAGISQVDIVVDVLEPSQAEACALDRGDLQQAALAALRDGRLAASVSDKASSWFHTLEVTVSTGAAGTWCVTFVTSELVTHVDGIPEADQAAPGEKWGSLLKGAMPLIRERTTVVAEAGEHAARVRQRVGEHASTIARRVRAANP